MAQGSDSNCSTLQLWLQLGDFTGVHFVEKTMKFSIVQHIGVCSHGNIQCLCNLVKCMMIEYFVKASVGSFIGDQCNAPRT